MRIEVIDSMRVAFPKPNEVGRVNQEITRGTLDGFGFTPGVEWPIEPVDASSISPETRYLHCTSWPMMGWEFDQLAQFASLEGVVIGSPDGDVGFRHDTLRILRTSPRRLLDLSGLRKLELVALHAIGSKVHLGQLSMLSGLKVLEIHGGSRIALTTCSLSAPLETFHISSFRGSCDVAALNLSIAHRRVILESCRSLATHICGVVGVHADELVLDECGTIPSGKALDPLRVGRIELLGTRILGRDA